MTPFIKVNDSYTIFAKFPCTLTKDHPQYEKIANILDNNLDQDITQYFNTEETIKTELTRSFTIKNHKLYYQETELHGYIVNKLLELHHKKLSTTRIINFLENLLQNPSNRVYENLYEFLEKGKNPITEDGHFLAFKRINKDYTDVHTSTFLNIPGNTLEMPRNLVDDNPNNTCSTGLHVCSLDYLKEFSGERIIICKVNPKDVVAIPIDYNQTKMRVCRYEVISEITLKEAEHYWETLEKREDPYYEEDKDEDEDIDKDYSLYKLTLKRFDAVDTIEYYCKASNLSEAREKAIEKHPNHTMTNWDYQ